MEESNGTHPGLYEALVEEFVRPVVAADRTGRVIEWNHAAERCVGISRDRAVGRPLWELQAAVAPAEIPYEQACSAARETFFRLVRQSDTEQHPWRFSAPTNILATTGKMYHARSEVFPVWIGQDLVIVSMLSDDGCAADDAEPSSVARGSTAGTAAEKAH